MDLADLTTDTYLPELDRRLTDINQATNSFELVSVTCRVACVASSFDCFFLQFSSHFQLRTHQVKQVTTPKGEVVFDLIYVLVAYG